MIALIPSTTPALHGHHETLALCVAGSGVLDGEPLVFYHAKLKSVADAFLCTLRNTTLLL
jgi:hypothetical protein